MMQEEEWNAYKVSLKELPREELESKALVLTCLLEQKRLLVEHYEGIIKEYRCLPN